MKSSRWRVKFGAGLPSNAPAVFAAHATCLDAHPLAVVAVHDIVFPTVEAP